MLMAIRPASANANNTQNSTRISNAVSPAALSCLWWSDVDLKEIHHNRRALFEDALGVLLDFGRTGMLTALVAGKPACELRPSWARSGKSAILFFPI